jgi:hypothetical protein
MPLMSPQQLATGQSLLAHVDVAAGTNVIENGDYELDVLGSRGLLGSERLERDPGIARHGRASLKAALPNAAGAGVAWVTRAGPRIGCRPGQSSAFSVDIYVPPAAAGQQVRAALRWYGAAPGEAELGVVEGPVHVLAGGWERLSVQARPAPAGTASITPSCAVVGPQGRFAVNLDVAHLAVGTAVVLGPPIPTNRGPVTSPDGTGQVLRWDAGLAQWQPATIAPWFDVTAYGADPTGAVDSTPALNAAIADAAASGGWAVVLCPAGDYAITQLRLKSRVALCGQGHKTTLVQVGGTDGDMIVLDGSRVEKVAIRDLRLVGNKAHQRSPNRGIFLGNVGAEFVDFDTGDSLHTIQNVFIKDCKGAGFAADSSVRDLHALRVHVSGCEGPGFDVVCTDSSFVACTAGGCGQGFLIRSYNTQYVACKAFGNVGTPASPGDGFIITAAGAKFSACEAQDNWGRGFVLSDASDCVLTAVAADSNGVKLAGDDSVAFRLADSHHCVVIGAAWNRRGQAATQEYALDLAGGSHDNVVMLTSRDHGTAHLRGAAGETNWVVINGRPRLPLVAAGNLPRAGADQDGTVLIENGGRGDRSLVYYSGGQRFRVGGTTF